MKRILILIFFVLFANVNLVYANETFGPKESRLIFDGDKNSIVYRMENNGKLAWLVQAWVEDANEVKTDLFKVVPMLFRVEPLSQSTAQVIKTKKLKEDRETLFWVVSNSLPGGENQKGTSKDDKIDAKLNLAFRYKVPMIYRPSSLKGIKQSPESLTWSVDRNGKMKVYNPTKYAIQLQHIKINGTQKEGKGITYIISPLSGSTLDLSAKVGLQFKYGIVNDYGAVNEYEGVVK
ncbi:fimbrial biogenesis chaperone [Escherichia coli]|uniref:fimbrial biogenesis chaperone n=1 Tax=Escherichia coli TaxID=562 RepID=UPI000BE5C4F5|nr:molecular chaperone [Escherichia coli]